MSGPKRESSKDGPTDLTKLGHSSLLGFLFLVAGFGNKALISFFFRLFCNRRLKDPDNKRSPHLVPYANVDDIIKKANRDTASETVRTLLVYGYVLEPPVGESLETGKLQSFSVPASRVVVKWPLIKKQGQISEVKYPVGIFLLVSCFFFRQHCTFC